MTIAQSTTIQAYQLRAGGTRARMTILRMIAADSVRNRNESTRLQPGDWRGARHYTIGSYAAAYGCFSQGGSDWYSHAGEEFRDERDAHTIYPRLERGWYTDGDCHEAAIGIVARLSHGRFVAGYRWTSNDGRAYFGEVFTDEIDAARMADEHARVFAESAREGDEQFRAAQAVETRLEESFKRLRECLVLRNRSCMDYARDEIRELIQAIRSDRDTLRNDFAGVL